MVARCALATGLMLVAACAPAWAAAPEPRTAQPVSPKGPDELWQPMTEAMQRLDLTDLQCHILAQVFHQYTHETSRPAADLPLAVTVEPAVPGGLYVLGPGGDLPVRLAVKVRAAGFPSAVQLRYSVQDFYGRKVAGGALPRVFPDASGAATADLTVGEATVFGYYHVLVTATAEGASVTGARGFAVVHPPTREADAGSGLGLVVPDGTNPAGIVPVASRLGARQLAFTWKTGGDALEAVRAAGLVPVPIVPMTIPQRRPEPAVFASTTAEALAPLAETAPAWHLGREPVLPDDDLAGAAASYRHTVAQVIEAVRPTGAALWVGTTPEILADVLTEGPVLAGAEGVTLYTDAGADEPSLRSGAYQRTVDFGVQMARRMGVKRAAVVTAADEPGAASPQQRAWKLVTRQVMAMAMGAETVFFAWDRGLPAPLPSAAAYAWMAHLIGRARYEGDAWADVPLLHGHVFSAPDCCVAVVWSWVGKDGGECDRGVLVFGNGLGLQAVDVVGHPVGIWKGERLIVPFSEAPVYLVSAELSAREMRDRLRQAQAVGVAPASVHVESIIRGQMPGKVRVTLCVQSHRPTRLTGRAGLLLPEGWTARDSKRQFDLQPGEAKEVSFDCDVADDQGPGPHTVEAVLSLDEEFVRHVQPVWVAQAPRRTVEVGYGLADWQGIAPVVVASADGTARAEVRTAWDRDHFYFSAAIARDRATFRAGQFAFEGDAIQLAWGDEGRADDDFGHPARGWALPGGAFRDTDHLLALVFTSEGPQVLRLRGPHIALRAHVPGNQDPWYGPVDGAQLDVARDREAGQTLVEAAIPWSALAPLAGKQDAIFRFGFRIGNGDGPPMTWSRAASVPAFLANPSSFLPLSEPSLPCQTWWGLVGEARR
ncbi:MAG: hypothetical protein ISS74_03655 [Planctomycetes bacterium]|nr:hypothetical protein [Planctomycetota bacterium]